MSHPVCVDTGFARWQSELARLERVRKEAKEREAVMQAAARKAQQVELPTQISEIASNLHTIARRIKHHTSPSGPVLMITTRAH